MALAFPCQIGPPHTPALVSHSLILLALAEEGKQTEPVFKLARMADWTRPGILLGSNPSTSNTVCQLPPADQTTSSLSDPFFPVCVEMLRTKSTQPGQIPGTCADTH